MKQKILKTIPLEYIVFAVISAAQSKDFDEKLPYNMFHRYNMFQACTCTNRILRLYVITEYLQ